MLNGSLSSLELSNIITRADVGFCSAIFYFINKKEKKSLFYTCFCLGLGRTILDFSLLTYASKECFYYCILSWLHGSLNIFVCIKRSRRLLSVNHEFVPKETLISVYKQRIVYFVSSHPHFF